MAELLFWASLAGLVVTYVGYPALMGALGRRPAGPPQPGREGSEADLPSATIVIAARDEATVIAPKLESCLAQDYPADRLDVILVSDGSIDGTPEVAARYGNRVRVVEIEEPVGKAVALNTAMAEVRSPIVVLTDARQLLDVHATRRLVEWFRDPAVGAVSGDLRYDRADEEGMRRALHSYWDYERRIRLGQSRMHSCVGATGALYAIRGELWRDLPPRTLLDDVFTPMQIVLSGFRVVFEPRAWARDEASASDDKEYWRRVRTLTGNYQLLLALPGVLDPLRNPVWLHFVFHKLGRLVSPLFLAGLLVGALLAEGLVYDIAYWGQIAFWSFAFATYWSRSRLRFSRPLALPYAFAVTQGAAVLAFFHFVRRDWNVWSRKG